MTKDDTGKVQGHDGIMTFARGVIGGGLKETIHIIRVPLDNKFRRMLNEGFWKPVEHAGFLVSGVDGLQKPKSGYKSYQTWQMVALGFDESDPYSKQ